MRQSFQVLFKMCNVRLELGAEQSCHTTKLVCAVTCLSSHNCCQFSTHVLPTYMHNTCACHHLAVIDILYKYCAGDHFVYRHPITAAAACMRCLLHDCAAFGVTIICCSAVSGCDDGLPDVRVSFVSNFGSG